MSVGKRDYSPQSFLKDKLRNKAKFTVSNVSVSQFLSDVNILPRRSYFI